MTITAELLAEFSSLGFHVASISIRLLDGRETELAAADRVDCSSLHALRVTMQRIMSEEMYAGRRPTEPEVCAAAYSVPDGAPVSMAIDNLGCTLSDGAAMQVAKWQATERKLRRRYG